jgi:uncharacterized membrane protein
MGLVAAVIAATAAPFVPMPSPAAWIVIAISAGLHVTYKLCLTAAYMRGDLGQAFPLARGMVPLCAATLALLTVGQVPTSTQWIGISLTSAGVLALAFGRLSGRPNWPMIAATSGSGLMVAAYSVLDAYGVRLSGDWAGFTAWLVIVDNVSFLILCFVLRGPALWGALMTDRTRVLVSGLLGLGSFTVFIWALGRGPVGAISALRETSVLFAVLIGIALHRERLTAIRIVGAGFILAGVVTIAV